MTQDQSMDAMIGNPGGPPSGHVAGVIGVGPACQSNGAALARVGGQCGVCLVWCGLLCPGGTGPCQPDGNQHVSELVPLFSDGGLHHLPVVQDDGRLVGMVTQSDQVGALFQSLQGSMPSPA